MPETTFFPDEQSYWAWIERMPPILRLLTGGGDELADYADGPYFYSPHYLILRVYGYYCALVRVATPGEADFTWYVASSPDEGETVYAAILRDRRQKDKIPGGKGKIIGGKRIQDAQEALAAFLDSGGRGRLTRLLRPEESEGA